MIELLILADDFTGAMDTAAQLRAERTVVCTIESAERILASNEDIQVLSVDTETRPVSPDRAYQTVCRLVRAAKAAGVRRLYKKADSGLRGNLGSELSAVLDASGQRRLHFVPAYPEMNRVTRQGIQYVDGIEVAKSAFGQDIFEPVRRSRVSELLRENWPAAICRDGQSKYPPSEDGVLIYDCASVTDMDGIAAALRSEHSLQTLAGCAGFARALRAQLALTPQKGAPKLPTQNLLILCGSLHPVTLRQLDKAEAEGALRIRLTGDQKIFKSAACEAINRWKDAIKNSSCAIIETASGYDAPDAGDGAGLRRQISETLGSLMKRLLDDGLRRTWFLTGGDTLLAALRALGLERLTPLYEPYPGVVCSRFFYGGEEHFLITKSGGFGEPGLLTDLQRQMGKNRRGETA